MGDLLRVILHKRGEEDVENPLAEDPHVEDHHAENHHAEDHHAENHHAENHHAEDHHAVVVEDPVRTTERKVLSVV